MTDLVNEFSWSRTRMKSFEDCRRMFWYSAYGGWGGWEKSAAERTKEIYVLSKLKSRWMWAGEAVHVAVAETLEAYRAGAQAPEIKLRERMREQWKSSNDRVYRKPKMAKTCALFEHEYEVGVDDWPEVAAHAEKCLAEFLRSPLHGELRALERPQWLAIEELDSFALDGVKVHVKLDAAHRWNGGIRIIDWKTGKSGEESDPFQLAVYALYAIDAWRATPDSILVIEANLATGKCFERRVTAEEIESTRARMLESIAAMKSLLRGSPDENVAVESDYEATRDPRLCRRCNFSKVCPDKPLKE